jgi:hypothetical protein
MDLYNELEFFNLERGPTWTTESYSDHQLVSFNGKDGPYVSRGEQMLFGNYFFMDSKRVSNVRYAYNFLDLITELGGIKAALFAFFGAIGVFINN